MKGKIKMEKKTKHKISLKPEEIEFLDKKIKKRVLRIDGIGYPIESFSVKDITEDETAVICIKIPLTEWEIEI